MLQTLLHNPHRLSLRRAIFQIHLWAGVILSVYLIVIAVTGAILVFEDELKGGPLPTGIHANDPAHTAAPADVAASFRSKHPGWALAYLTLPTPSVPAFLINATDPQKREINLIADPQTGEVLPEHHTWLDTVRDLH